MKKTKLISLSLCAGLALSAFAGCSDTEETTAETTVETTVETTAETAAETSAETTAETIAETSEATPRETVSLEGDSQTYANTFITNFVEQNFYAYDRDSATNEMLLDFAHLHIKINSPDSISISQIGDLSYETFPADQAGKVIVKYMGKLISDDDLAALSAPPETFGDQPAGPYYADSNIYYQAADGEMHSKIGVVDKIDNPGDGTLTLKFTIYSIDMDTFESLSGDGLRGYYKLTSDQAKADNTLTAAGSGTAVVGVAQSGDYYLISYKTA